MKCFIPRVLKAGVWYGNKRIPLPACVYIEIKKEFPVDSMKGMQDLTLKEFEED